MARMRYVNSYFKRNVAFWSHFVAVAEKGKWNESFLTSSILLKPSHDCQHTYSCSVLPRCYLSHKMCRGEHFSSGGQTDKMARPVLRFGLENHLGTQRSLFVSRQPSWSGQLLPKQGAVQRGLQPQWAFPGWGWRAAAVVFLLPFSSSFKIICLSFLANSLASSALLSLHFLPTNFPGSAFNPDLRCYHTALSHSMMCYIPLSAQTVSSLGWDTTSLYWA